MTPTGSAFQWMHFVSVSQFRVASGLTVGLLVRLFVCRVETSRRCQKFGAASLDETTTSREWWILSGNWGVRREASPGLVNRCGTIRFTTILGSEYNVSFVRRLDSPRSTTKRNGETRGTSSQYSSDKQSKARSV